MVSENYGHMRVALLSDIHGNLPALEAVLEDLPPVDSVVCAGDIVGYNPWPAECVNLIQDVCDAVVMGNHDRMVKRPHQYASNPMAEAGLELAYEALSNSQLEWLESLPRRVTIAEEYLLVHDHPKHQDKYVFPHEFPTLRPYLDDYAGVIIGHTHIQHEALIDGRLIVNPGSVGQPRDSSPGAAYAILDADHQEFEARRVDYDVDRVLSKVEETGLPVETGTRLLDGS